MRKNLLIFFILIFLLAGCATKEEQTAAPREEMGQKQQSEQVQAAPEVPETKPMEAESGPAQSSLPKEIDYSTSRVSDKGFYTVSYKTIGGAIKINRIQSWEVTVSDADGKPVNDAKLILSGKMVENDHGLPINPVITRAGFEGLYRIDKMQFDMPGLWLISIDIMAGETSDSVSFYLDIH